MSDPYYHSIHTYLDNSYETFSSYDRFKFIFSFMAPHLETAESLLDIGCAKGEFLYSIRDEFPDLHYTGIETSDELLRLAASQPELAGARFIKDSALTFDLQEEFDIALMSGVLSLFDDIEPPLERMAHHIRRGGHGFVFSGFNSNDIDVIVRHRNNVKGTQDWESGLNMFSLNTVRKSLSRFSTEIASHKFQLSIDLEPHEDPIRSYTLNTKEQGRIIVNGANIIRDFYLTEFVKS
jgi:trans-aconitate methyltransferase